MNSPITETSQSNRAKFISLFVVTLIAMLSFGLIVPILPLYARLMHANGLQLGMIFSGFALSRAFFALIVGDFSDRYGRKKLIVLGLILAIPLAILFTMATTPLMMTVIRIAQGFSTVCISLVAQAYIGDITPQGKEGKYMNLFFISFFLGQSLGPYLGGLLSDAYGIKAPFYLMAILYSITLLLILMLVPESPIAANAIHRKKSENNFFRRVGPVLTDRPMMGIMGYMFSRGFYRWGFNAFFPILAVKAASLSASSIGLILSGYMIAGSIVQFPSGLLADRYPGRRTHYIFYGGVLSAVIMCFIADFHTLPVFLLLTMGMGLSSAFARSSAVAIRTERGRIHGMGAVTGAFTFSISLGQIIGPLIFGAIVDSLNIRSAFLLGGIVGLAGTFFAVIFLKKYVSGAAHTQPPYINDELLS